MGLGPPLLASWGDVHPEASLNLTPVVMPARAPPRVFVREEKIFVALCLFVSI